MRWGGKEELGAAAQGSAKKPADYETGTARKVAEPFLSPKHCFPNPFST